MTRLDEHLECAVADRGIVPMAHRESAERFGTQPSHVMGAIGLMLMMIRRGAVSKVAALIYLVPPTAALQAYFMFGETLTGLQIVFMVVVAIGVFLATRR